MTDTADPDQIPDDDPPKRGGKLPLVLGLVGALVLGGGGFFSVWSGMILPPDKADNAAQEEKAGVPDMPDIAFVPLDPLTINLSDAGRHLRFRAELEVSASAQAEVEALLPRVVDVMNSYLRAIALEDLERPAALVRLRAQLLRRIQIVTGEGRVQDLLIMEFVLN